MSIGTEAAILSRRSPASPGLVVAGLVAVVVVAAALVPGLLAPYDPLVTQIANALQPPSLEHPFGTDASGRDVLSRVIFGARHSLAVGAGATVVALLVGGLLGVLSGMSPRWLDAVFGRIIEVIMAFPEFLIALLIMAILGPGESSVVAAVALAAIPAYARVARAETLVHRRSGPMGAARVLGVHPLAAAARHILPAVLRPLGVMATIGLGTAIVSAAGLGFLGLGATDPTPEWGLILSGGRNLLATAWWVAVFPGLVITATVIAASTIGRALRRRADAS